LNQGWQRGIQNTTPDWQSHARKQDTDSKHESRHEQVEIPHSLRECRHGITENQFAFHMKLKRFND